MNKLLSYIVYRRALLLYYVIAVAVVTTLQYLTGQDSGITGYTVLLLSFFLLIILLIDGRRYYKHRKMLENISDCLINCASELVLPEPSDPLEGEYLKLLRELANEYEALKKKVSMLQNDSLEYYTLWVHQIKTPIAALSLVLSKMEDSQAGVIKQELFKVERYADMALRYIKLSDISSDLVIETCALSELIRESAKKFSVLFVYQKLSLDIMPTKQTVLSDKRWLGFILEQLISNAVKYTNSGAVKIYIENGRLIIEDSGIGIRPEDLPRIFDKGYTGYNGRIDSRASGIGLYLAKKAADALGITIKIKSELGKGTKVYLGFPETDSDIFM
jgi:signal transduction histidine kinase